VVEDEPIMSAEYRLSVICSQTDPRSSRTVCLRQLNFLLFIPPDRRCQISYLVWLSVCLSYHNSGKPWARKFIFVMQVHLWGIQINFIYEGQVTGPNVKVALSQKPVTFRCLLT